MYWSFECVPGLSGTRYARDMETVSQLNIQGVHAQPKIVVYSIVFICYHDVYYV